MPKCPRGWGREEGGRVEIVSTEMGNGISSRKKVNNKSNESITNLIQYIYARVINDIDLFG